MFVPGPKPRPALVIDIGRLGDDPAVEVIYGTSRKLDRLYPGEFSIVQEDGDAFAASGLSHPTKFDTARSAFLPYNDDWFFVPAGAPMDKRPSSASCIRALCAARRRRSLPRPEPAESNPRRPNPARF
jgi:hypothetical protein